MEMTRVRVERRALRTARLLRHGPRRTIGLMRCDHPAMVLPRRVPRSLRALLIGALIGLMGPWAATARARPAPPSVEVRDPAWIGKDGRPKPRVRNRARREGRLHEHRLHSARLDREYFARVGMQGVYHGYQAHNTHFRVWSAMYMGDEEEALAA